MRNTGAFIITYIILLFLIIIFSIMGPNTLL